MSDNQIDVFINLKNNAKTAQTEFNSFMDNFSKIMDKVKRAYDETAAAAINYSNEIESLQSITQTGTIETIKLVEAADDSRVSFEAVRAAARKMVDDGIQPSVENVAKLADEYNAIVDPAARSAFAMEKFGMRAGPEFAKLLAEGGAAIREAANGNQQFAETMAGGQEEMKIYQAELDSLMDTWGQFKLMAGTEIIPILNDIISGLRGEVSAMNDLAQAIEDRQRREQGQMTRAQAASLAAVEASHAQINAMREMRMEDTKTAPAIKNITDLINKETKASRESIDARDQYNEAIRRTQTAYVDVKANMMDADKRARNSAESLAAGLSGGFRRAQEGYNDTVAATTERKAELLAEIEKLKRWGYSELGSKIQSLRGELADLDESERNAKKTMAETTKELVYQKMAAGLDAAAALELARAMGLVSETDYQATIAAQKLNEQYAKTGDIEGYTAAANLLYLALLDGKLTAEEMKRILESMNGKEFSATFRLDMTGSGGTPGRYTPYKPPTAAEGEVGLDDWKKPVTPSPKPEAGAENVLPAAGATTINFYGEQAAAVARAMLKDIKANRVNMDMGG